MKMTSVFTPKVNRVVSKLSEDGLVVTTIADAMVVSLEPVETPRAFGRTPIEPQLLNTLDATLFIPVDEPGKVAGTIDVRGAFSLDAGCTGVLLIRMGGKTFTREFQGKPNDFTVRFKFEHAVSAGLVLYAAILIERDLTGGKLPGGFLGVDSIDIAIKPTSGGKPAKKKTAKKS